MRQAELTIGICVFFLLQGCHYVTSADPWQSKVTWRSSGVQGGGAPGTRYFALWSPPVQFRASGFGTDLELDCYRGGCYAAPLDQFEMHFADLRGWAGDHVAMTYADGRCVRAAVHCRGVVCNTYAFEHDAAGRVRRRVDSDYEGRRKGESPREWAKRWKGRTPPVVCVSELEYAWSRDGGSVEVILRSRRGEPRGFRPIEPPWVPLRRRQPGQKLETWRVNDQGAIVSVAREGKVVYAARRDAAGRLVRYERAGAKVANRYDGRGRLLERRIEDAEGEIVIHQYPDGPEMTGLSRETFGQRIWLVTHDSDGWVSRIREYGGPSDDIMVNQFQDFGRDKQGRIIRRRIGYVLPDGKDAPLPLKNWGYQGASP